MSVPQTETQLAPCIDIGVNLTNKRFRQDITNVIHAARHAGVTKMIVTGTSVLESKRAAQLCLNYPGILYSTAGIHPHDAKSCDERSRAELELLLAAESTVAVGECGLDYNRDFSPRDQQLAAFELQLKLAAELQLPVFMHERDAHGPFVELVKAYRDDLVGGVVHCFTGSLREAEVYLDLDLHLGVTGWICDERRGLHLVDVVRRIPENRMMIETDAPYLAPRDIRPKIGRNEPKYLPHILSTIARHTGRPIVQLASVLFNTTVNFFQLKEPDESC